MSETLNVESAPAVAVQRVVRHHDEATMKSILTDAVSWYDPASGEVVVRAARMKAMEQALNEILECSNGHFNPLFKCKCYEKAHALVMPNNGTQRPGSPDVSLATETRKPGSLK